MIVMGKKKPKRSGVNLGVYMPPPLIRALEEHIEGTQPRVTKTAIVRMLLENYLRQQGRWPPKAKE